MNDKLTLPAFDPEEIQVRIGTQYPASLAAPCAERRKRVLGDAVGLSHFGVNMVELPPGSQSSLRHWHSAEDEFVFILDGVATLVTDEGAQQLGPGMAAGFPAGEANGHHLINNGEQVVRYIEVGDRTEGDEVDYPDDDLLRRMHEGEGRFVNKQGEPY